MAVSDEDSGHKMLNPGPRCGGAPGAKAAGGGVDHGLDGRTGRNCLKKLWQDGLSASQIAKQLGGVTRNAVIGKVHRLGLSGRATPSKPARHGVQGPASGASRRGPPRRARAEPVAAAASRRQPAPADAGRSYVEEAPGSATRADPRRPHVQVADRRSVAATASPSAAAARTKAPTAWNTLSVAYQPAAGRKKRAGAERTGPLACAATSDPGTRRRDGAVG